jgi:hypothetical protein
MTQYTGLYDGRVDGLLCFYPFFLIGMTGKTEGIALLMQATGKIALMIIMASRAIAGCYGRVHYLVLRDTFRVTLKAELRYCLLQHCFIRRLMRIMTTYAVAPHDRSMDDSFFVFCFMTLVTEVCAGLDQGKSDIPRMFAGFFTGPDLMAGRAHSLFNRIMHGLFPAHARVALR